MNYKKEVFFSVTGTYGNHPEGEDDVYTVQEFKEFCASGAFIDYDGYGHPVKDRKSDLEIYIRPSKLNMIPEDATHIVWYNR